LDPETMTLADKFREEGRKQGFEEGLKQGFEKRRLEVASEMLCIVLEGRFGPVPHSLSEVLGGIRDFESLRGLYHHAIRCGSLEQFTASL